MQLPSFGHLEPRSLGEALELLAMHAEQAKPIAGGTELLVSMKQGLLAPAYVVDLKQIPGVDSVVEETEGLRIGALTRLSALIRSPLVQEHSPLLAEAASAVAAPPLQEMGTVGGNLCQNTRCFYYNQSRFWRQVRGPCYKTGGDRCHVVEGGNRCFATYQGDLAPALIALGATVTLAKEGSERRLPLAELYTGKGKRPLALVTGEVLTEVRVPAASAGAGGDYQKLRQRGAMDYPLVGVAAAVGKDGSDVCAWARIALTGVSTGPLVVQEASELLVGRPVDEALLSQVAEAAYELARPVNNVGSEATYRRKMVRVLTRRALLNAWGRE
ncbi:MAG: FAD binding domain-containing protein [Anaerolineae bacterium]|nr:FAD binding domain-containing protein [Anaerolineae bacterium]